MRIIDAGKVPTKDELEKDCFGQRSDVTERKGERYNIDQGTWFAVCTSTGALDVRSWHDPEKGSA